MDALEAVQGARTLLTNVTPMRADCGALCGARCCRPDADGRGGMLLFPGEQALYKDAPWAALSPCGEVMPGMTLLTCNGSCPRAERPLACRLFPLIPVISQGCLRVMRDVRAWPVCPLMQGGLRGMNGDFVTAVRQCARLLAQNDDNRAYMTALGAHLARYRAWGNE